MHSFPKDQLNKSHGGHAGKAPVNLYPCNNSTFSCSIITYFKEVKILPELKLSMTPPPLNYSSNSGDPPPPSPPTINNEHSLNILTLVQVDCIAHDGQQFYDLTPLIKNDANYEVFISCFLCI